MLATDPWVRGSAYFGSWGLSHEVPAAQDAAIRAAGAVWFSHGHPDHLNPASLPLFRDTRILLPDHVGGRIARDLTRDGYRVEVLPDRTWVRISDRVRVLCIADEGQDAVLLVDVGGRLVVNLNDAQDRGWGRLVKRVIRHFPRSFLLRLSGYGDADMINFVDEDGVPVPSLAQLRKESGFEVGADVARMTETFGANALRAVQLVPPLPADRQRVGERVDHAGGRVRPRVPLGPGRRSSPPSCATTARPTRGRRSTPRRRPTSRSHPRSSATTGPTRSTATT